METVQFDIFDAQAQPSTIPFKTQLLKWIGNKQRFAHEIISFFPSRFGRYYEPFLGSGAVLGTLGRDASLGSDTCKPLIDIWQTLAAKPEELKKWYRDRWESFVRGDKVTAFEKIKASYNARPNSPDLLFLCRSCYGGVMRFRKRDGYMSTPCGPHDPVSPASFAKRVDAWHERVENSAFENIEYQEAMMRARPEDLIYCDPPYLHSQPILYRAQDFSIRELFSTISECKSRGVYVVLSIDGVKKSGNKACPLPTPKGLFEREVFVNCGRSMLKRFQMNGLTLEKEVVTDRLLLTY